MNWRSPRRTPRAERIADAVTVRARRVIVAFAYLALACAQIAPVHAQDDASLRFAVIASALTRPADEAPVHQLLDAIARERDIAFIVYDGNLKGAAEPCRDSVFQARHDLLDASRTPLILLPGQRDWADCSLAHAGAYDPVERLDFVRQLFFADANSLGQNPLQLARESDVARFRTFREFVRWQENGVAFIGLNAPSPNNHYLTAGGRNGEFEDRAVAMSFWIEHAAETARRSGMRALVVMLQGDPDFSRYERRERFAWLRFSRASQPRDGFLELKRSLVKAAETFRGPIIVIHGTDAPEPNGFHIDQPLRNDRGLTVGNLTRVAIAFRKPQSQWLDIQSDAAWHPPFRLRVRNVSDVHVRDTNAAPDAVPAQPSAPPAYLAPSSMPPAVPRNDAPQMQPQMQPDTPPDDAPPPFALPQALPPIYPVPDAGSKGSGQ